MYMPSRNGIFLVKLADFYLMTFFHSGINSFIHKKSYPNLDNNCLVTTGPFPREVSENHPSE